MKTCPFCREEVHAEAVKCRHCHSALDGGAAQAPSPPGAPHDAPVVYVVDRGFLRFGKFTAGAIAVLALVGAVLYGQDLDRLSDKLRDAQAEIDRTEGELAVARTELSAALDELHGVRDQVKDTAARLEASLAETEAARADMQEAMAEMQRLMVDLRAERDRAGDLLAEIAALEADAREVGDRAEAEMKAAAAEAAEAVAETAPGAVAALRDPARCAADAARTADLRRGFADLSRRRAELRADLSRLEAEAGRMEKNLFLRPVAAPLRDSARLVKSELTKLDGALRDAQRKLDEAARSAARC